MKAELLLLLAVIATVNSVRHTAVAAADVIYYGGDILTMREETPRYVESVSVKDGLIVEAGPMPPRSQISPNTKLVNLNGSALLPGFIDAHGHIANAAVLALFANLYPLPDGNVNNFDQFVKVAQEWAGRNKAFIDTTGWIIGFGYDDIQLKEGKHPDRYLLDKISKDKPVLAIFQSMHSGVINSKGLELMGITKDTPNPTNGFIVKDLKTGEPTGQLKENAFFNVFFRIAPKFSPQMMVQAMVDGQKIFSSNGCTTASDGRTSKQDLKLLTNVAKMGKLDIDIYSFYDYVTILDDVKEFEPFLGKKYNNKFRIAGGKLGLDGSIQGGTGWLNAPYTITPEGEKPGFSGLPAYATDDQVQKSIQKIESMGLQVSAHVNGDAAVDQLLRVIKNLRGPDYNESASSGPNFKFTNLDNKRLIAIHSQMATVSNLKTMMKYKVIPSFFGAHVFYWGDAHKDRTIGAVRAARISPAKTAKSLNMLYTEHLDVPVVSPNILRMVSAVVNRKTRKGFVLGPLEKLTVYEALLSTTKYAAFQVFEEDRKGSIEKGLLADFVILNQNPMKVKPEDIESIKVLETIKEGKTIYKST